MSDCNLSTLELIKLTGFYQNNFSGLSDDIFTNAIKEVECLDLGAIKLKKCPLFYSRWLALSAVNKVRLSIKSIVRNEVGDIQSISLNEINAKPNLYLKSQEIMGVKCEYAQITKCLKCDSIEHKLLSDIEAYEVACIQDIAECGGGTEWGGLDDYSCGGCYS